MKTYISTFLLVLFFSPSFAFADQGAFKNKTSITSQLIFFKVNF